MKASGAAVSLDGTCHCQQLSVQVRLADAPIRFAPRACDCSYCQAHGASWLSDPAGKLLLRAAGQAGLTVYRQGSGQAEFLLCARCGILAAALLSTGQRRYAAVNSRLFAHRFGDPVTASPQQLDAASKAQRWKSIWFPDVAIERIAAR